MRNKLRLLGINIIICLTLVFAMISNQAKHDNPPITQVSVINEGPFVGPLSSISLSFQDSVKQYIDSLNIAHSDIVMAQARLESGNFTSRIFCKNNNMFGMRLAKSRPTVAIGERYGYAVYDNWQQSVLDYALLQAWSYKRLSRGDYLVRLSEQYAEDPNYVNKVR